MIDRIYYKDGYKYQLAQDYTILLHIYPGKLIQTDFITMTLDGRLTIYKGYCWDGASGPAIDSKTSMRGSLVHDALFQLLRLGELAPIWRMKADEYLETICEEDGMWKVRAGLWRKVVKLFAGAAANPKNEKKVLSAP